MRGSPESEWQGHVVEVRACRRCPGVLAPPVIVSLPRARIYLMGQAPGPTERAEGRGFCGSAGRTLFRWFASIGVEEAQFRERVFLGAVIRCFPGKLEGRQGDRRPSPGEVQRCAAHFDREIALLRPELVLLVGKLAMERFLPRGPLEAVVGRTFDLSHHGQAFSAVPLPHPSGLSRWIQREPGKSLLERALHVLRDHPVWREVFDPRR